MMGGAYAKYILGKETPRIGVLSNGEEEGKGNELTREVHNILTETDLNYIGYVEGRDLNSGEVDVIVCDGFVGNVALKISERTCCVCRSKREKRLLARIVSVDDALVWDVHQNLPGRGGYVHLTPECVLKMGEPARWERVQTSLGQVLSGQVGGGKGGKKGGGLNEILGDYEFRFFDDTAVPGPLSATLLLIGGLGLLRRRKL
jgi:predicted RNA-binding protein YlxR (DUF448 family)